MAALMFVAFVQLTVLGLLLDQAHGLVYRLVMRRLYGSVGAQMRSAGVSV